MTDPVIQSEKVRVLVAQSCLILCNPWTVAQEAPTSMVFSRKEYWSELQFPSPGELSNPGIKQGSPVLQVDSLPTELLGKPPHIHTYINTKSHAKQTHTYTHSHINSLTHKYTQASAIIKIKLRVIYAIQAGSY